MYRVKDYINIDKEILSGNPVFKGTRVPIQTLFDHLERGISLDEFLDDFPTVSKDQSIAVIEIASKILTAKNIREIYEAALDENLPKRLKQDSEEYEVCTGQNYDSDTTQRNFGEVYPMLEHC